MAKDDKFLETQDAIEKNIESLENTSNVNYYRRMRASVLETNPLGQSSLNMDEVREEGDENKDADDNSS